MQPVISAKQYHSLKIHFSLAIDSQETHVVSVTLVAVATHVVTMQLIKHNSVCPFLFLLCIQLLKNVQLVHLRQ